MYLCTEIIDIQRDMEEKKHLTVKEWANEDKPREKMILHGKKELTNAELIAILLRSGVTGKSAVDVAKDILYMAGNRLTTLSRLEYSQLASVKGLGTAKATTLLAALELGWRMQGEISDDKELVIKDSTGLFNYMKPLLVDLPTRSSGPSSSVSTTESSHANASPWEDRPRRRSIHGSFSEARSSVKH